MIQEVKAQIIDALVAHMVDSPRSQQSAAGILGPSDIGFCRQKAALTLWQIPETDNPPRWSAAVGTAIHNYVEQAIKDRYPSWIVGSIDNLETTTLLPSGVEIKGHPDIVVPDKNLVLDIKTVDGFAWVKREGTSVQHKYQRHLYAMGLVQMGVLSDENLMVGNVYLDRSGKEPDPLVLIEEFDPTLTAEIDSWIDDVIYAVKHQEDARRDIASPVCERICSHFTACRGSLPDQDGDMIEDPQLIHAVEMYVQARDMEKEAQDIKREAQSRLAGVSGSTGTHQVRWTEVQPAVVESFQKQGYMRMDIRKTRSR
jgi:hypothetical protein